MRVACFTTTDRNKWLNRLNVDCNRQSIEGYIFRIPLEMNLKLSTIQFIQKQPALLIAPENRLIELTRSRLESVGKLMLKLILNFLLVPNQIPKRRNTMMVIYQDRV